MDYKEFYKSELFPDKDVEITDEYLIRHGWHKYGDISNPKTKWYYFDNGTLGRINVDACSDKHLYTLHINYETGDSRAVNTVADVKAAIYSYICGLQAVKYGYDNTCGGYRYLLVDTKEEEDVYRYKKYCEMVKAIENKRKKRTTPTAK